MKLLLVLSALVALACCDQQLQERLFQRFDGADHCMSREEFNRFWLETFDASHDGQITEAEFINEWRHGFRYGDHVPIYFMEMDRTRDEVIAKDDLAHMFNLFDIDGSDCIRQQEFETEWDGLFAIRNDD